MSTIACQVRESTPQLQERGGRAVQTVQRVPDRSSAREQTAAERVQDSSTSALTEAARAADVLGSELRGLGEGSTEIGEANSDESETDGSKAGSTIGKDVSELASDVGETSGEVAGDGQENLGQSLRQLNKADDVVGRNIPEAADEETSTVQEQENGIETQVISSRRRLLLFSGARLISSLLTSSVLACQVRESTSQLQEQGDRVIQTAQTVLGRIGTKAQTAAQRVQDSSLSALTETIKAADVLGSELRGLGEVVVNVPGEAAGLSNSNSRDISNTEETSSYVTSTTRDSRLADAKLRREDTSVSGVDVEKRESVNGDFEDVNKKLKVLVASDTGRLGRSVYF